MEIGIESDPDVARMLEWIRSLSRNDIDRRFEAAKEHFLTTCLPPKGSILWPSPFDLLPPIDLPAGYLLQAHAILRDRRFFDAQLASRTIPFLKLIGSTLPGLSLVEGAEERVREFLNPRNDHPEGTMLELATAARYLQEGYRLRFIPRSNEKTPDIELLTKHGKIQIECKRLRTSQYEISEINKVRSMFDLGCNVVDSRNSFVHLDVTFLTELHSIPDSYLVDHIEHAINQMPTEYVWRDAFARGKVVNGNIKALLEDTEKSSLLVGPKFIRLFAKTVVPSQRVMIGVRGQPNEQDRRYLHSFEAAALCTWDTESAESVAARARHVRSKLADIDRQLQGCETGAAHIVLDADRDSNTADVRRESILEEITNFDFESNIRTITTHYLRTHAAESSSWTIDETADYHSSTVISLLEEPRLLSKGIELGTEPAWRYPAPN